MNFEELIECLQTDKAIEAIGYAEQIDIIASLKRLQAIDAQLGQGEAVATVKMRAISWDVVTGEPTLLEPELVDYDEDLIEDGTKLYTDPQSKPVTDADIDRHLDAVLRASGSSLRHYTMPKTLADMRQAMRVAMAHIPASSQAATDVLAERTRQIHAEGWSPERDDGYRKCELASAASAYALSAAGWLGGQPFCWPWSADWWKPSEQRRDLVKAGALILAEIERLDRAELREGRLP